MSEFGHKTAPIWFKTNTVLELLCHNDALMLAHAHVLQQLDCNITRKVDWAALSSEIPVHEAEVLKEPL